MSDIKERGNASFIAELDNGVITIKHGTADAILAQWVAEQGDWDKIWDTINELKEGK